MLTLELRRGMIYFSTNSKREIQVAIDFLKKNESIMDNAGTMERTIFDFKEKYDKGIR